ESLVWGEEYLDIPDGECEQGTTICVKGLLELGGKGRKGVIEKAGFMSGKLAQAMYLVWSLNDGLIANGLADGFPS
ncbi:hypothetical protein EJD97_006601, partial [Solanum chilense]